MSRELYCIEEWFLYRGVVLEYSALWWYQGFSHKFRKACCFLFKNVNKWLLYIQQYVCRKEGMSLPTCLTGLWETLSGTYGEIIALLGHH